MTGNKKLSSVLPGTNKLYLEEVARSANNRSQFLSTLMKACSGPIGDKLVSAYANGDDATFASVWSEVAKSLINEVKTKGETASAIVAAQNARTLEEAGIVDKVKSLFSKGGKAKGKTPLKDLMAQYGQLRAKGKDNSDPKVAALGEQIGKIKNAIGNKLKGKGTKKATLEKASPETETASDTEKTGIVVMPADQVDEGAAGLWIGVAEWLVSIEDFNVVEEQHVADKAAAQTVIDRLLIKYDLRPDQVAWNL